MPTETVERYVGVEGGGAAAFEADLELATGVVVGGDGEEGLFQ